MSRERGGKHVYLNQHTGKTIPSFDKRNELAIDGFGSATYIGEEVLTTCPLCLGLMTHNGSTVEHIVCKAQLLSDRVCSSAEIADEKVGHPSNLLTSHAGCNSSKNQKDVFDWWLSDNSKSYITPSNRERIHNLLSHIRERHAKYRVTHFPYGEYKSIILQIARRASEAS